MKKTGSQKSRVRLSLRLLRFGHQHNANVLPTSDERFCKLLNLIAKNQR
jgi:hypothetical protein